MPVAIVGLYPVTVAAVGTEELHKVLCGSVRPSRSSKIDLDMSLYTETKHAYLDSTTKLALAAASGAMSNAGWKESSETVGLSLGSALGCGTSASAHDGALAAKGGRFVSPFIFSHSYPNSPNVVISMDLGLKRFNTCIVCGVVSGGMVVGQAFDQITLEREKKMLAGGSDAADGNIQGACFLAIQDSESAESEDRRVLASLLSWRCAAAGHEELIGSALDEAGLNSAEVDVTAGNVETGLGNQLDFDAFLGSTMGASAVLDTASLCVLSNLGWPDGSPLHRNALIVRRDPAGLTCILVLRLACRD